MKKMKRIVLKNWVQWLLIVIVFITTISICSLKEGLALKDFTLISIIGIIINTICLLILYKYGRWDE